jgi:hypothetical protein
MWKTVHWTAYAAWPFALFHAAGTGTDTRLSPQLLLYGTCVAAVVAAVWWRLAQAWPVTRRIRWWVLSVTGLIPVLLGVFLATGPLRPGWSHRAAATFPSRPPASSAPLAPGPSSPALPPSPVPHDQDGGDSR